METKNKTNGKDRKTDGIGVTEQPSEEQAKEYLAILRNTTEEEIERAYGTVYFDGFGGICRKGKSEEELLVELESDEINQLNEMGIDPNFSMKEGDWKWKER